MAATTNVQFAAARLRLHEWAVQSPMLNVITKYLATKLDAPLANSIMQKDKTANQLEAYVMNSARTALSGKNGCLPDDQVYGYALAYLSGKVVSKASTKPTPSKTVSTKAACPASEPAKKPQQPIVDQAGQYSFL